MQPWKTLSKQTVLTCSKFLTVESHTVELPDGQIISEWPWVITPSYANVVAITEDGAFLCFRQTKYAVDNTTLAIVGGYLEPGEDPLTAAKRELLEETGYEASDWVGFGQYPVDANRGAGNAHLFLASNAFRVAQPDPDDLENQQLLHFSRAQIEIALAAGEFKVLAWTANIALALLHLDNKSSA